MIVKKFYKPKYLEVSRVIAAVTKKAVSCKGTTLCYVKAHDSHPWNEAADAVANTLQLRDRRLARD